MRGNIEADAARAVDGIKRVGQIVAGSGADLEERVGSGTLSALEACEEVLAEFGPQPPKQVLTTDYQAQDVKDVSCPSGQRIKQGATFTCTLNAGGADQQVTVTILDDDGKYEVSRPSPKE